MDKNKTKNVCNLFIFIKYGYESVSIIDLIDFWEKKKIWNN